MSDVSPIMPVETPKEIIAEALADAHDLDMTDALYAKAIVRKLEAAGYRIVSAEGVTDEMVRTLLHPNTPNWKHALGAAILAAPLFGKGSEK